LANDATIPTGIVVNVNDAVCPGREAGLDKLVVRAEVTLVERSTGGARTRGNISGTCQTSQKEDRQVLPAHWQAEGIHSIIPLEVLHLTSTICRDHDAIIAVAIWRAHLSDEFYVSASV
jgi:hypothetical protein